MVYLQLPSLLYGTNWPGTVSLYHILRNSSYYCQPYGLNWPGTVSHNGIIWNIHQPVYGGTDLGLFHLLIYCGIMPSLFYGTNWPGTISAYHILRNYAWPGRPDLGPGTVLHNYLIWNIWHHWSKGQTDLGVLTCMQQNMSADAISGPREIEEQQERFPPPSHLPTSPPPHLPTPGLPWQN